MPKLKPVRVGLIGCGEACEFNHMPALLRLNDARIAAVADPISARAQHIADQCNGPQIFPDAKSLLAADIVDVVAILAPPEFHRSIAEQVLHVGVPILLEKPAGLTLEDTDALETASQLSGARILMGFHMRWHRLVRRARKQLLAGDLGTVGAIIGAWNSPLPHHGVPDWKSHRSAGGGVLFETAVHFFDLWRHLSGAEIESVFAWSRSGPREDEQAVITAKLTNGILVTAQASSNTAHSIEIEISGTEGRLHLSGQKFDGFDWYRRNETAGMIGPRLRGLWNFFQELPGGIAGLQRGGDYTDSYQEMWKHFLQCIAEGTEPACTLDDGREALRAVLAAVESAETSRPVRIAAARKEIARSVPALGRFERFNVRTGR